MNTKFCWEVAGEVASVKLGMGEAISRYGHIVDQEQLKDFAASIESANITDNDNETVTFHYDDPE